MSVNVKFIKIVIIEYQMVIYKQWAHQAMSQVFEVVTFPRHKNHLPIICSQLETLQSWILSFLSGVLLEWIMNMDKKTRFNDFLDANDQISEIESGLKITVWSAPKMILMHE